MTELENFMKGRPIESLYFEAKPAPNGIPRDFWETYSAFANTFGGTIVLGLSEDGSRNRCVPGVNDPLGIVGTLWDDLNNPCITNHNLLLNRDVTIEEINGETIIVIRVPAADRCKRPVYVWNNMGSGTFRRNHDGDYHCTPPEIEQMVRDSGNGTQDMGVLPDLTIECFDRDTISRYLRELSVKNPGHIWSRIPVEEFLELSGAMVSKEGVQHPTAAGLLMFGKVGSIRRIFGNFFLDYRETDEQGKVMHRIHSDSGLWGGNIYDFGSEVMNRVSLKIGSPFALNGFSNMEHSEKLICVREAIVNALVHADYRLSRGIDIGLSPGIITVSNPGTMRVRLSDARRGAASDPRNLTLMTFAAAVGWTERTGSGIQRIEKAAKEGNLGFAEISEDSDPSHVTFSLGLSEKVSDPKEACILEILRKCPASSRESMAEQLGISVSTVGNILARLKARNRIERVGNRRSGHWVVK